MPKNNETEAVTKTARQRKLDKLKRQPVQFVKDSTVYVKAQKSVMYTWAKFEREVRR